MSSVIKLFNTLKKHYKIFGLDISPSQSSHEAKFTFHATNIFQLISPVPLYVSSTAFFFFKAQTPDENGTSFYVSITLLTIAINIVVFEWKMPKIMELIERYEEFIANS